MSVFDKRLASLSPEKQKLFDMLLKSKGLMQEEQRVQADQPALNRSQYEAGLKLTRPITFSVFFFSEEANNVSRNKYELIIESAKLADKLGFEAIWTPERHFHAFGGLYPNPSVLTAALAMVTNKLELRAGSVVMPLHHPIRIAEEWSVVDNLSSGRVGLGFASGWHMDDFVLAPEAYQARKDLTFSNIEIIKKLWGGESVSWMGANGRETEVEIYPKPISSSLPIWITSAGSEDTFIKAGEIGANILTGLTGQSVEELGKKIKAYRNSLEQHGHGSQSGRVSLMLHTFIGENEADIKEQVRGPMYSYLKTNLGLHRNLAQSRNSSVGQEFTSADEDALLQFAFDRYFNGSSLFGTPLSCDRMLNRLNEIEIDEACCLVDFGINPDAILEGIRHLAVLKDRVTVLNPLPSATQISEPTGSIKGASHV
jgi:natural product biosynthesis luciferase-like monooxygenase protein